MTFNIKKTFSLPNINDRVASCLYMVKPLNATFFEFYWSNEIKEIVPGITDSYINDAIVQATSNLSTVYYATTISTRDLLTFTSNAMILVADATADPTVATGSAMYFYLASNSSFIKIVEFESMDLSLNWSVLLDKPVASVIDIDDSVVKRHEHSNKTTLDKFTETSNKFLFDSKQVGIFVFVTEMPLVDLIPNALYIINNVTSGQLEFVFVEGDGVTTHKAFVKDDTAALIDERITIGTTNQIALYDGAKWVGSNFPYDISFASSDEISGLAVGTSKITLRAARAFVLTGIKASVNTAQVSGNLLTVNVRKDAVSVLSTLLTFNNASKTTVDATVPAVLTSPTISFAADAEITVDITQIGDGTAKGLKIYLLGHL